MPTIIEPLEKEGRELLHSFLMGMYLNGECYAFAIALHEGLSWPIIGLMVGDEIVHAAVMDPERNLYDARGKVSRQEFGNPFSVRLPYTLRELEEHELFDVRPVSKGSINTARSMAEAVWPSLPWINSRAAQIHAYLEEIEKISRKHGFWLRSPVPASPPCLAVGDGTEGGYRARPTIDASTFMVDRYFAE